MRMLLLRQRGKWACRVQPVNKYVIRLEAELGVQLLNRSTRRVSSTETGKAFYDRCVAILGDLEEAEIAVSRLQDEPKGTLKVNAADVIWHAISKPGIGRFHDALSRFAN